MEFRSRNIGETGVEAHLLYTLSGKFVVILIKDFIHDCAFVLNMNYRLFSDGGIVTTTESITYTAARNLKISLIHFWTIEACFIKCYECFALINAVTRVFLVRSHIIKSAVTTGIK